MSRKYTLLGVGIILVIIVVIFWHRSNQLDTSKLTTTAVSANDVVQMVSVSGYLEADSTAELTFPSSGRISSILVKEGDFVSEGAVLATVGNSTYAAEQAKLLAQLAQAKSSQQELLIGQTTEENAVTEATISQAKSAWEKTTATELEKIESAKASLNSTDLFAKSIDTQERAATPTVSGSYTCDTEGIYEIEVYNSSANSGYSIKYTGLESGTESVSTRKPAPLGDCGLNLQFTDEEYYGNSTWIIEVPNRNSSTYLSRLRAYELVQEQAKQNIAAAKETLNLAENIATRDTAAPRIEALIRANAVVAASQADLAKLDASLEDKALYAPFNGVITNIEMSVGEISTTKPVLTLLANDSYTLVARVPEIDITKIIVGQSVEAIFDANPNEPQDATVHFVSPIATVIDGVSYYETKILLTNKPDWLRSGLNADINIIIKRKSETLSIPQRYITDNSVTILKNNNLKKERVEIGLEGTNGMVEIKNLPTGTIVVAP